MYGSVLFSGGILIAAIAFGVIALGFPWMSLQEGFGPGLFPILIAGAIGILALFEFLARFGDLRRSWRKAKAPSDAEISTLPIGVTGADLVSAAIVIVAVVATVLLIPVITFVPAGACLIFVLSLVMGTRPIWKCAAIAVFAAGTIYLIFAKGFNVIFAF